MFLKGQIIWSEKRKDKSIGFHPIIYWKKIDENDFIGLMLTSKSSYRTVSNIEFSDDEFYKKKPNSNSDKISFLVPCLFTKYFYWQPFIQIGCLSEIGIEQIEKIIETVKFIEGVDYEEYVQELKNNDDKK
jgi:hypothetical protein